MITAVAFAGLAAAGALARAEAGRRWNAHDGFPLGTLAVNVLGSFALGLLHEWSGPGLTVVGVGGLGAFTTVSSYARDVVALLEFKQAARAVAYVALTGGLGVGAAWVGMSLAG